LIFTVTTQSSHDHLFHAVHFVLHFSDLLRESAALTVFRTSRISGGHLKGHSVEVEVEFEFFVVLFAASVWLLAFWCFVFHLVFHVFHPLTCIPYSTSSHILNQLFVEAPQNGHSSDVSKFFAYPEPIVCGSTSKRSFQRRFEILRVDTCRTLC